MDGERKNLPAIPARSWRSNRWLSAGLQIVPTIGPILNEAVVGGWEAKRRERIERTLAEVMQEVERLGRATRLQDERFGVLLESVMPALSRATEEEKRLMLRDLLVNAGVETSDASDWGDAELAGRLITEIDAPGLKIVAAIHRGDGTMDIVAKPEPQVVRAGSDFTWDDPQLLGEPLDFGWEVIEEWVRRLNELRIIRQRTHDQRGGFGEVSLTSLGRLLVRWSVRAEDGAGS